MWDSKVVHSEVSYGLALLRQLASARGELHIPHGNGGTTQWTAVGGLILARGLWHAARALWGGLGGRGAGPHQVVIARVTCHERVRIADL